MRYILYTYVTHKCVHFMFSKSPQPVLANGDFA